MDRRQFIRTIGTAILGGAAGATWAEDLVERSTTGMRTRNLGRTGHRSSLVTFAGYAVHGVSQAEANRAVAEAIDAGVNHFDVAPSYGDAEKHLGPALEGKRDRVFLGCKTLERQKAGAAKELRASLKTLRTDHFDLYQVHGLDKPEDLDTVLGPGGAMEAFLEARDAGLIRFIGITGHRPAVHLDAVRRFPFDTVMVPVNFVLEHHHQFTVELLAELARRRIGVIAIKALAARPWAKDEQREYPGCWYRPIDDDREVELALRFTLSQQVATAVPPADVRLVRKAIAAGKRYRRLDQAGEAKLAALAEELKPIFG
ncbi:MAG: aldo/keto reductase [Armatimonadota bacterium]|nr:MAG: aldo/keto reductase [Armatimonadota bacterium]